MVRIAIAGPGRSGTSLLVKLFDAWGFKTDVSDWHEDAKAGLETRIDSTKDLEIFKDPWLYEYLLRLPDEVVNSYDVIIVPMRDAESVARSRLVQERLRRLSNSENDEWLWNTWGETNGGALFETTLDSVTQVMHAGLWQLCQGIAEHNLPVRFIAFPRLVTDFEYLWSVLGDLAGSRISRTEAEAIWLRIADTSKVRIQSRTSDLSSEELLDVVHAQQEKYRTLIESSIFSFAAMKTANFIKKRFSQFRKS